MKYSIVEITKRAYYFEVEADSPDEALSKLKRGEYLRHIETIELSPEYHKPIELSKS